MEVERIVEIAIQSPEFQENTLDHVKLAQLAGFNDEEIEFVKLFWDPTFNKSWIYLTKELVIDWMGYKDNKSTMSDFYRSLRKNYETDVDYKEVDQNNDLVAKSHPDLNQDAKIGNRAKFYIITGECLKGLLMSTNTMKGKLIKKIYIKTEKLVFVMLEVIKHQQLLIKDAEIALHKSQLEVKDKLLLEAHNQNKKLDKKILNIMPYKESGYVYIASNENWSNDNIFRIGTSKNIEDRIGGYHVGSLPEEKLYYVYSFKTECPELLETLLRSLLEKFRLIKKNDQYILHWHILLPFVQMVCNNFHQILIHGINTVIAENIEISQEPFIPERIQINLDIKENFIKVENIESDEVDFITPTAPEYNPEEITSDEDIAALPNKFLRNKATKRNQFINQMKEIDMEVVSTYRTIEHSITLRCQNQHIFDIIPNNHELGRVICNVCENVRKTNEATLLVADRNMICLDYKERRFRCEKGHDFITSKINYLLHQNGGCSECNRRVKLTKIHYHDAAKASNGKWIETEVVPTAVFLTSWECPQKHIFRAKYRKACDEDWSELCQDCRDPNIKDDYISRINKIVSLYPSGRLLTAATDLKTQYTRITLACDHMPAGWSLIQKNFLATASWRCSKCKGETVTIDDSPDKAENITQDESSSQGESSTSEAAKYSNLYYKIRAIADKYDRVKIVTKKETIKLKSDIINFKCPHKTWSCKASSINNKAWGCFTCKADLAADENI